MAKVAETAPGRGLKQSIYLSNLHGEKRVKSVSDLGPIARQLGTETSQRREVSATE